MPQSVLLALFFCLALCPLHVKAQQAKPLFRVEREFSTCVHHPEAMVHPDKYMACQNEKLDYVIANLHTGTSTQLKPLREYEGIPLSTKVDDPSQRNASLISGNHRSLNRYEVLWTNGSSVGVYVSGFAYYKPDTTPKCPTCGGDAKIHEKMQQYYCPACNRLISSYNAMKSVHISYWAVVDLTTEKAVSQALPDGYLYRMGNDFPGGKFWFYREDPCPSCTTTQPLNLIAINTSTGAKVSEFSIQVPLRTNNRGFRGQVSRSGKTIFLVEYDELMDKDRGALSNPTVSAFLINTTTQTALRTDAMVTTYGFAVDEKNDRVFMGSNQLGKLVLKKGSTGDTIKTVTIPKGIAQVSLSADGARLFVYTKTEFLILDAAKLTVLNKVAVKKIYPGVDKWMVAETVFTTHDGLRLITPPLIRSQYGPWGQSDPAVGFRVFLLP